MEEEHQVTPGMLLAAWPDMLDPNFMHGVILVCQHAPAGAYGVVVNRPSPNTTADLLGDHPVLGQVPFPVHVGGPVEPETMQFLHTVPDEVPGGTCLDGRIWFGGEIEGVARLISADFDRAKRCVRVLVGYAGWGAGQLESELGTGSWLPAPPSDALIFDEAGGVDTWRRVIQSIGGGADGLADLPPDVSWN